MRKSHLFTVSVLFSFAFISSAFGVLPEIITTKVVQVAPGVIHRTMEAPSKPWMIYALEMDLSNPALELKAVDGGGLQKPSVMASALETTNYRLVGATNGDFYEPDYTTTNAGVINGKMTKLEKLSDDNPVYWSALSIGEANKPTISCNKFEGTVQVGAETIAVADVNGSLGSNELGLFNHFKGSTTGETSATEVRIQPLDGWKVNEPMVCTMISKNSTGNSALNNSTAILSGYGTAATFLNDHYSEGGTLEVLLEMKAFEDLSTYGVSYNYLDLVKPMKYLVGGFPMFVRNGENYAVSGYRNENGGGSFATDLHPRTAVGYNADTTKIYFVVVDGRQTSSTGINLIDLADIMIDLGAWRAMNFDGGGSTVMVVDDDVVNSPSDGVERSVRNCMAIYSTAPEGELSQVQIELDTMKIYRKQSFDFSASGWDDNFNPKTVADWGSVDVYCDSSIGSIEGANGNYSFTASKNGIEGYVYLDLNSELSDSMYVEPISINPLIISPANAMTDTIKEISYTVRGVKDDGDTVNVGSSVLEFSVKDPLIGNIDEKGVFKGKADGETFIYVRYGSQCDSANVTVVLGEGECALDRIETIEGWTLTGNNLDSLNTFISIAEREDGVNGDYAMRIDYKTVDNGKIYLAKDIEVPGIPHYIMLDVLSDGLNHRMYVNLEDVNGNSFTVYQSGYVNNAENYETLFMDVSGINAAYPIKVKNIYIKLNSGIQTGTLYIDDLRMTYPINSELDNHNAGMIPGDFILHGAYPNPFNPSTMIHYELTQDADVSLSIYNLRGEMVDMLMNQRQYAGSYSISWTPDAHASGCYLYELKVDGISKIGKLLFMK